MLQSSLLRLRKQLFGSGSSEYLVISTKFSRHVVNQPEYAKIKSSTSHTQICTFFKKKITVVLASNSLKKETYSILEEFQEIPVMEMCLLLLLKGLKFQFMPTNIFFACHSAHINPVKEHLPK